MEDKIQAFRQPMVTATGIILGFMLNFALNWVRVDSPLGDGLAYFVGLCVLAGAISLILVLYRILRMSYPRDKGEQYYNNTLRLFIFGIGVSFLGALIDMSSHFLQS
jgi:multisubunit Na+/H+ antiporter MnhB subunit